MRSLLDAVSLQDRRKGERYGDGVGMCANEFVVLGTLVPIPEMRDVSCSGKRVISQASGVGLCRRH